jgi:tRNA G26 N,N-dimethylase Trm1
MYVLSIIYECIVYDFRCLIANTLAAYCQTDFSLLPQIKCVEAIGSTGINALIWAKHLPLDKINIMVNAPSEVAKQRICENVELNGLTDHIDVTQGFTRAVLDENTFNFM